jgi:hypothetical protein
MPKNGSFTPYDDEGFPLNAVTTLPLTIVTSLTAQAIKGSAGRLLKIAVTTALAGSGGTLVFWDNAAAGSGTPLFVLPVASGTLGAIFTIDLPAANGIYMTNPSGTVTAGAVTIGYS